MRKLYVLAVAVICVIAVVLSLYLFPVSKHCENAEDCAAVGCECYCSGCGGFSSEDVVNKGYAQLWYIQHNCRPPMVCPEVCCQPAYIDCESNTCVVKEGFKEN